MNRTSGQPIAIADEKAAALETLWQDLRPALEYFFESTSNDPTKPPTLGYSHQMHVYSAIFNALTSKRGQKHKQGPPVRAKDLYLRVDQYYASLARNILVEAPGDDYALVNYLVQRFQRFSAGAYAASRLFNYFQRTYVAGEMAEDKSRCTRGPCPGDPPELFRIRIKEMRAENLTDWGFVERGSVELRERAEACAQAASSERVVPFVPLAYRGFRKEVINPLLADPDSVEDSTGTGDMQFHPQCRLARGVQTCIVQGELDAEDRTHLAKELAAMLQITGMKITYPLWRILDDFITSNTSSA